MPKKKKNNNKNKKASAGDEVEFDNPLNDAEVAVFDADVAEEGSATVFDAEDGAGVEGVEVKVGTKARWRATRWFSRGSHSTIVSKMWYSDSGAISARTTSQGRSKR